MRNPLHLVRDESGVNAVEFALVLPVMLTLLLGGIAISSLLQVDRKTTAIAAAVADLVAQAKVITDDDRDDVFHAAEALMVPFDPAQVQVVLSSVVWVNGEARVAWSDGLRHAPRVVNSVVTGEMPAGIIGTGTSVIMAEVIYPYTDPIGKYLTSEITLTDKFYNRPRRAVAVGRVP